MQPPFYFTFTALPDTLDAGWPAAAPADLHQDELRANWERAPERKPLSPIQPLP